MTMHYGGVRRGFPENVFLHCSFVVFLTPCLPKLQLTNRLVGRAPAVETEALDPNTFRTPAKSLEPVTRNETSSKWSGGTSGDSLANVWRQSSKQCIHLADKSSESMSGRDFK
jgi:hypothetical protein